MLEDDFDDFADWNQESALEKALDPFNRRMWDLCDAAELRGIGLLGFWAPYARKYPHKVTQMGA